MWTQSLCAQTRQDTIPPIEIVPTDTIVRADTLATDSVATSKKDALEAPVQFTAKDSISFERGGYAHLFGEGKINYQQIELDAPLITMNMDSSTVFARGLVDSVGVTTNKPVFKDGSDSYETNWMRYNFKSRRAHIANVSTQQGEGYLIGENAKKGAQDELYLADGKYTTCDHHDHPHFYLRVTRSKVRPGKNIVGGPTQLVIEDVPTPIFLPFFFFPFTSTYSSGIIMPSYMDDSTRGFGLSGGGYYFAISDRMDAKILGDIFTKGSFALQGETNYVQRYKYAGALQFSYQVTKLGDKNMPDYSEAKDFKIVWNHRQDAKASPNSSFSATVNFATSSYEQKNLQNIYNPSLQAQNTKTSNIAYSRSFPDQHLTLSGTFNIAQRMQDSTIAMTLPDLNIALSRIYPLKKKKRVGEEKWYEKISLSYSGRITNSITSKDDEIFQKSLIRDWRNGMQHSVPVNATFTLFDYINVTPSFNYTERWYTKKIMQDYNASGQVVPTDTLYGFYRIYNYNASLSLNTKLYGMYKPLFMKSKDIQIRHVFSPQISFSTAPDFGSARYGYYETITYTDENGDVRTTEYSPYASQPFGVPGRGKSGSMSFSMSNNVEMKMRGGENDSIEYVKRSLIDELGASISYNFAAKERPWSDLSLSLRMKLSKSYTLSMNSSFATYAYEFDKSGNVVVGNRTEWSYGRFGRWQGYSTSFNYTFNNDTFKKWFGKDKETAPAPDAGNQTPPADPNAQSEEPPTETPSGKRVERAQAGADGYQAFKMPWSFNFNYGVTIREDRSKPINTKTMRYPYSLTHTLNFSGNINISNKWKVNFNSGYDFKAKEITQTTFNVSRDLHCFTMVATFSPFGRWKTYNFTIRATAQILQDLKWEQRSQTQSNIAWY
jgi:hypothetical protein